MCSTQPEASWLVGVLSEWSTTVLADPVDRAQNESSPTVNLTRRSIVLGCSTWDIEWERRVVEWGGFEPPSRIQTGCGTLVASLRFSLTP